VTTSTNAFAEIRNRDTTSSVIAWTVTAHTTVSISLLTLNDRTAHSHNGAVSQAHFSVQQAAASLR
jgi:hypothetical protein